MLEGRIYLSPSKDHTFLIRSLSGMAINATGSPAGVNVNVAGAVQIDGQKLLSGACNAGLAGSFEVQNGCFYYCDGTFRQAFNVAFNEGTTPANPDVNECLHIGRCEFDGIKLRPGDKVTAYKYERDANCNDVAIKKDITCQQSGYFDYGNFPFSYCMPWDKT
jgi:hypothetical protein